MEEISLNQSKIFLLLEPGRRVFATWKKKLEKEGAKEVSEIILLASLLSLHRVYRGKRKAYFCVCICAFVYISATGSGNKQELYSIALISPRMLSPSLLI